MTILLVLAAINARAADVYVSQPVDGVPAYSSQPTDASYVLLLKERSPVAASLQPPVRLLESADLRNGATRLPLAVHRHF